MRGGGLTDDAVAALHQELFDARVLEPLEMGGHDERAWADCDLASFAENRLGDGTDPRGIDETGRAWWRSRATTEPEYLPHRRDYERCCWILDGDERAGTIALASSTLGGLNMRIASLYVYPTFRGRGLGRDALRKVAERLEERDLGLRLNTNWTWQRTVRGYLRMGMWIRMWKRDLEFRFRVSDPAPIVAIEGAQASLSVPSNGHLVTLLAARREGDRLILEERDDAGVGRLEELAWDAWGTLALELAMRGWPLVRSQKDWEACHYSDGGAPESLAHRIPAWEAWDRAHGWKVETPRIAGLDYPTWSELEERWRRDQQALTSKT
ncbi:MAG: GNAT family N-acetyltransferase [Polyangiaceae bacterium]|nr:GNAT family N-acetyltransferase [Polyangiaceae bacterium]